MENIHTTDSYIAVLEHRLAALTAERDRFRAEAICLSEELQGLQTLSERLSSERDNLRGVVEKMQRELRELRRMLFGRKSERFIPSDPSQLKLDFEGAAQLQQEREYAAQQESASISRNKPASRTAKSTEDRQRRIFSEHLERRDEFIEPNEIPAGSKRIGEEITELLEYKPGELYIRRLIRPKYALLGGEGVIIGQLPSLPLPKSNAGPSLLAQLLVGKYQDHLPLHRQIAIFARGSVHLKASTVCDWCRAQQNCSNRFTCVCASGYWAAIIFRSMRASFRFWIRTSRELRVKVIIGWCAHRNTVRYSFITTKAPVRNMWP